MLRLVQAILVITSGIAIDTSLGASWSQISTGLPSSPVNVSAIAIAPGTPSTLYANTRSPEGASGIFKSTDGAGTWKALSGVAGVNLLVVDPKNPSTIYAVTGRGLLKSTNGGDSWIGAGAGFPTNSYISALAIDPVTPSTLYAVVGGTGGGIFRSTDAGGSWNALNTGFPPNTFINSLVIDPVTPSRIYAVAAIPQMGGPSSAAILRSTDGGESWNALDTGLPPNSGTRSLAIAPTTPSIIYATAFLGGPVGPPRASILKSVDGGTSWNTINTGLPPGGSVVSLTIDPKNSSTVYLVVLFPLAEAGGILKSTDGGTTWTAINPGLPANTPIQTLAIDPVSSSIIYMVADGRLFKSTDGGARWNRATTGLTTIDVRAVATNRVDPATVYAGAGNGVFKSVDSGASWTNLFAFRLFVPTSPPPAVGPFFPDGEPAYPASLQIGSTDPNILYASTFRGNGCYYADNLLFKSTDGGANWTDSVSPDRSGCVFGGFFGPSGGLKALDPTDPNTVYAAETDDEDGGWWLLRSTDGGASWKNMGDFPGNQQAGVWALAIDPSNPATLYAGLDDPSVYSEDDGSVKPGLGGAFKSTDGGASWNRIGLDGAAVNLLVIDAANPNVLYAATEGDYGVPRGFRGLFRSTDSGATWSPINNGLASLRDSGGRMTAIVMDPASSNILYAGTSSGVFKSSDGGANWSRLNDGLTSLDVRSLAVAPGSRHTLYAGTAGGVFRIVETAP